MKYAFLLLLLLAMFNTACRKEESQKKELKGQITLNTFLEEMIDRENLIMHPNGSWTQHQASSYERLSVSPENPEGWYANHDWNHFVDTIIINGRKEYVLMDTNGPGVITRIWIAGDPNRKSPLRFYIDGDTIPVWEASHPGALIGEHHDIGRPLSSRSVEQDQLPINKGARPGHNLYLPIPFNKHIRITYEEKSPGRPGAPDGLFYNINYRLYHGNTSIESLNHQTIDKSRAAILDINNKLSTFQKQKPTEVRIEGEEKVETKSFKLKDKGFGELTVTGSLSVLRLLLSVEAKDMDEAVKRLWIQGMFDGKTTIEAPVGLFFGCGDQLVHAADWYRKVDTLGNMACFWVMPFKKEGKIKLVNKSGQPIAAKLEVATKESEWTDNSMYFHCQYADKLGYDIIAKEGEDYDYATVQSRGVFIGDNLQISKSIAGWWGEGDEKIFVDGEKFPSHFGTGTEDYFGYAWGHPEIFDHPFVGQPIGQANLLTGGGVTVNSKVRALDAIPFNKSLNFDMEQWAWFDGKIDLKWACFWYGD